MGKKATLNMSYTVKKKDERHITEITKICLINKCP